MDQSFHDNSETTMLVKVPTQVMGLSVAYSVALGWLERKFPNIKPDHIWAEVAGGVLISLVPVALEARRQSHRREKESGTSLSWQTYEGAIWRSFFASGTPIILWQLGEAIFRHMELMRYTTYGDGRSLEVDAHGTTALASGSGEREGADAADVHEGDSASAGSPGQD
jgi:hypothetical protein